MCRLPGFLSFTPDPAGEKIRGAVEDTSSQADMTRAQADSPGAVFEVGLRENRVSQSGGGQQNNCHTDTHGLSFPHACMAKCLLAEFHLNSPAETTVGTVPEENSSVTAWRRH